MNRSTRITLAAFAGIIAFYLLYQVAIEKQAQINFEVVVAEVVLTHEQKSSLSDFGLVLQIPSDRANYVTANANDLTETHLNQLPVINKREQFGALNLMLPGTGFDFYQPIISSRTNNRVKILAHTQLTSATGKMTAFESDTLSSLTERTKYEPNSHLRLEIVPYLDHNNAIQLRLKASATNILAFQNDVSGIQPTLIGHREADIGASLKSGEVVVLYGWQIKGPHLEDAGQLAVLTDIPTIGTLFKVNPSNPIPNMSEELIFFIRPTITSTSK